MTANPAPQSLGSLEALIRAAGEGTGPRPVEKWNPPYCGDIGLKISGDGVWFYQGSPIGSSFADPGMEYCVVATRRRRSSRLFDWPRKNAARSHTNAQPDKGCAGLDRCFR